MSKERGPQSKLWIQIPANLATMNDEEIDVFAQSLWKELSHRLGGAH